MISCPHSFLVRTIALSVIAAIACLAANATPPQRAVVRAPGVGQTWTGLVVVVADGDTVEIMRNGRAVRVRLAGIDAPEYRQAWNRRARSRLAELVFQRSVTVLVRDVDRYGREVVDVTLADGRRVNDVLVREGLAWFYSSYSNDAELKRLEAEAQSARRGLWSDRSPTPPWLWRKRHAKPRP